MSTFLKAFQSYAAKPPMTSTGTGIVRRFAPLADDGDIFGRGSETTGEIFGRELTDFEDIPSFLTEYMEYLLQHYSQTQGIFRKNGSKDHIDDIQEILDMGEEFCAQDVEESFPDPSGHDIAGVVKLFFRTMPTPLLSYEMYDEWIGAMNETKPQGGGDWNRSQKARLVRVKELVRRLPEISRKLLQKLLAFLAEMATHKQENLMGTDQLALVFAPNLIRPEFLDLAAFQDAGTIVSLVTFMIDEHASLFVSL